MSLAQALQHMLKMKLITLRDPHPNPENSSPNYNPNAICVYHSDSPGHDMNDCWALKNNIQDLINEGVLEFTQGDQTEVFCHPSKEHHLK